MPTQEQLNQKIAELTAVVTAGDAEVMSAFGRLNTLVETLRSQIADPVPQASLDAIQAEIARIQALTTAAQGQGN